VTRTSGTKTVVAARVARNDRLANACIQWAFVALSASPGGAALPGTPTAPAAPRTTRRCAPWATAWSAPCTAAWPATSPTRSSWPGRPPNRRRPEHPGRGVPGRGAPRPAGRPGRPRVGGAGGA
jgi:hypothetical protein